ncbi:hypothetical protein OG883_29820 [Streptomyces sp. NBC_01142]|uniref:hypothetical protein n=1 Tax=Streptomyces sp. NBC_01142 TaxID=2975865 RepID=UPI002253E7DE|nr:hypothetical protein [Streptomyces sp. NBC_01142]MCX4824000.1 hypothetical protein [Streptomyces sp. NBC_01142]
MSKDVRGTVKNWPWRSNTGATDTTKRWKTTASYDRGLFVIGVQTARFKGDKLVNYCTDW